MILLNLLFPRTCVGCGRRGVYFCSVCVSEFDRASSVCPICNKGSVSGLVHDGCRRAHGMEGLVVIFAYRHGVKLAVKRLKYRFVKDLARSFVEIAAVNLDQDLAGFFKLKGFSVVPVPLHKARKKWRGFDQAEILGEQLAYNLGLEFRRVLERVKNTKALAELQPFIERKEEEEIDERYPSLTTRRIEKNKLLREKKRKMRKNEMKEAFRVKNGVQLNEDNILLVDDVWTSGSTMLECAKILRRQGSGAVWGFALARG